jgi:GNAT superfamily N-acetyltransferase
LRNAEARDSGAIAEILAHAFPTLYRGTFGRWRHTDIVSLLHALYDAGHLPLDDTRLAEVDGHVVAVMVLHTGLPIGRGSAAGYWRLLQQRFGLWQSPRMFWGGIMANVMLDRRIPRAPDLVYIEALAVAESHRGLGLGSLLLADAEQWARARGRSRLALHVLASNTGARRLYERTGFRPWQGTPVRPRWQPSLPTPSWSAILMARTLQPNT